MNHKIFNDFCWLPTKSWCLVYKMSGPVDYVTSIGFSGHRVSSGFRVHQRCQRPPARVHQRPIQRHHRGGHASRWVNSMSSNQHYVLLQFCGLEKSLWSSWGLNSAIFRLTQVQFCGIWWVLSTITRLLRKVSVLFCDDPRKMCTIGPGGRVSTKEEKWQSNFSLTTSAIIFPWNYFFCLQK